jgi:hypothetical protein
LALLSLVARVLVEKTANPRNLQINQHYRERSGVEAFGPEFTVLSCNKLILQFKKAVLPSCMVTLINEPTAASSKCVPRLEVTWTVHKLRELSMTGREKKGFRLLKLTESPDGDV